jgi:hypothetical protein
MNRILRKLLILPFVLPAVIVNFDGCWRPVTSALGYVGIDVHTYGDELVFSFGDSGHDHDD